MRKEQHVYTGETIGELTVLEELAPHITPNGSKQRIIKCRCSCGKEFSIRLVSALKSKKCQECRNKERRKDLTGKRFGKLVVLSMADDYVSPSGHRLSKCSCLCDCGKKTVVFMSDLITGSTRSCGCEHNSKGLLKDYPELVRKYDYVKNGELGIDFQTLTARSSKKVWWKCEKCGLSWYATIASQNDKIQHGCPYCAKMRGRLEKTDQKTISSRTRAEWNPKKRVIKGKTDLATLFPDIAAEWNYSKNGTLTPGEVSSKSGSKVWWKCKEGHEWQAKISNRTTKGSGCPKCNIETATSFCEQAVFYYIKKLFPDAINSDYHLDIEVDIYIPSINTAIEYDGEAWHSAEKRVKNDEKKNSICAEAGVRLIRIREPKLPDIRNCIVINRSDSTTSKSLDKAIVELIAALGGAAIEVNTDADTGFILQQIATKKYENSLSKCFPEVAAEWHPTKNGNLTPDEIDKASRRKVWWLGKCGHEWQAVVGDRTRPIKQGKNGRTKKPYGCPFCSGKRMLVGFNDLESRFPEVAAEWHPTKNGGLKPSDIMPGSKKKIWWLGRCGHEWQATPNKRCGSDRQCPICYKEKRSPAVICVETGKAYKSGLEAAREYGLVSGSAIYKCCRGETKEAGGVHWIFLSGESTQ